MISSQSNPDYTQLRDALTLAYSNNTPSEIHGLICGVICNQIKSGRTSRPHELVGTIVGIDDKHANRLDILLETLYESCSEDLSRSDAGFSLLLPDDDHDLAERTHALGEWCRGFILGLLHNRALNMGALPGDASEMTEDLMAISQAEPGDESPERDEWALAELEEYVRMGVQLVYEELLANGKQEHS